MIVSNMANATYGLADPDNFLAETMMMRPLYYEGSTTTAD